MTEAQTLEIARNEYGIPTDPAIARDEVVSGALKLTEEPDKVTSGIVIEAFPITVRSKNGDDETIHYTTGTNDKGESNRTQPYAWSKVDSIPGVFEALGGAMTDDQVGFVAQALGGDDLGKASAKLIDIFNTYTRGNARQNEYQRVTNMYKPMDEEDKAKAIERMITTFVQVYGVSREVARQQVAAMAAAAAGSK